MPERPLSRVKRFRAELMTDRDNHLRWGRWNYRAAYALTTVTVLSSAAAAILGLGFENIDRKVVALIALIPAIAVTVATQFKWQEKANWHYRKSDAARAVLRRIDYELPERGKDTDLGELVRGYSTTEAELSKRWEEELQFAAEEAEADEVREEGELGGDGGEDRGRAGDDRLKGTDEA